jgi:LysR family glycine cleavage system transcriptional activator
MRDQLEHITVDLVFGSASEVVDRLRNSEVDAAVTTAKLSHKEWTADALHPEQHVLVGAPDLLADQPFDTPADAAAHTLLDIDESLPLGRHLTGTDRDVRFGTTRLGGDAMAIRLMVLQGLGVAVLPRDIVAKDIEAGRLTPILGHDELHTNEYSLVYRSMSVFDSALKRLAGFLAGRPIADF